MTTSLPVEISWHENETVYLSARQINGRLHLRLHRLFRDAPLSFLDAVLRCAALSDRATMKRLVHSYLSRTIKEAKPLEHSGAVYDLQEIFLRLIRICPLEGVSIGWSVRRRRFRGRSIWLGSYDPYARQIQIHSALDDPDIPLYFLEFVVYHEMLHAFCSAKMDNRGRYIAHTREFREKEKAFPDYLRAKEWERSTFFREKFCGGA